MPSFLRMYVVQLNAFVNGGAVAIFGGTTGGRRLVAPIVEEGWKGETAEMIFAALAVETAEAEAVVFMAWTVGPAGLVTEAAGRVPKGPFFRLLCESWRRVLTTQIGLVAIPVQTPALAAASKWTQGASRPLLNFSAMMSFMLPYVKNCIDLKEASSLGISTQVRASGGGER